MERRRGQKKARDDEGGDTGQIKGVGEENREEEERKKKETMKGEEKVDK